ncbi:MAG TPA: hypothetical protein VIH76_08870 [Candidatus Acidoferrales bacterium]
MSFRRALPWLVLAGILVVYVASVSRLHSENFFGRTHDDTIYFSSAKALAEGQGYILPSVPGTPPATEYPILYPWVLSWVWRWNPSFPANLTDAIRITILFGVIFITLTFQFLRSFKGIAEAEALLLTAFCALHPIFIGYSGAIMTEIPFATVALAAMVIAERAMARDSRAAQTVACGVFSGFSMLLRILGAPIAAGIFISGVTWRAWRQTIIWSAAVAPFFLWLAWRAVSAIRVFPPADAGPPGPAYVQTWTYYTSYIGFRKLCMTSAHVVWEMFVSQFIYLLAHIPGLFIGSLFGEHIGLWFVGTLAVLYLIVAGMVRQAKLGGWRPVHYSLAFYLAAVLTWQYPEIKRFLVPFLPLFAASLWFGGKIVLRDLWSVIRGPRPTVEKSLAAVAAALILALAVGMAGTFAFSGRGSMVTDSKDAARLLAEKREAYDWLRANSSPDARAVATEDVALYLYTGRQAMSHIALNPAGLYDPAQMRRDLDHMTDVAKGIGAAYWIASPDDSGKESKAAKPLLAARYAEIEGVLPELFQSSGGRVKIYGTNCILHPDEAACASADRVLFPAADFSSSH